jgi:hypothetical protein
MIKDYPVDESENPGTDLAPTGTFKLNEESRALIEQIISETDDQKVRDLTQLFNANQNKKTMARVNKLSDLLDTITDQAFARFTTRPDEISNKELLDSLKVVQDLIERGQKQVSGAGETPLIQVNQQTNEVNINGTASNLNRDSRERVKAAVLSLLNGINTAVQPEAPSDIIEVEAAEITEEESDGDE